MRRSRTRSVSLGRRQLTHLEGASKDENDVHSFFRMVVALLPGDWHRPVRRGPGRLGRPETQPAQFRFPGGFADAILCGLVRTLALILRVPPIVDAANVRALVAVGILASDALQ